MGDWACDNAFDSIQISVANIEQSRTGFQTLQSQSACFSTMFQSPFVSITHSSLFVTRPHLASRKSHDSLFCRVDPETFGSCPFGTVADGNVGPRVAQRYQILASSPLVPGQNCCVDLQVYNFNQQCFFMNGAFSVHHRYLISQPGSGRTQEAFFRDAFCCGHSEQMPLTQPGQRGDVSRCRESLAAVLRNVLSLA